MSFGTTELLVIFGILLLLFGSRRLRSLGSDLGSAIKGFRKSVTTDKEEPGGEELLQNPKMTQDDVAEKNNDTHS